MRLVYELVRKAILDKLRDKVDAIVVYGSVNRPEDFAASVSDIDVAVVTREKVSTEEKIGIYGDSELRLDVVFLTEEQLEELAREGYPIAHYIARDGVVVYGSSALLERLRPAVTERTVRMLKKYSIASLASAVELYLMGLAEESVSNLHKALRHAIRWRAARERGEVPIGNGEIAEASLELGLDRTVLETFSELAEARKGKVEGRECKEMIERTLEALRVVGLFERATPWSMVEEEMRKSGRVLGVRPSLEGTRLLWKLTVYDEESGDYSTIEL